MSLCKGDQEKAKKCLKAEYSTGALEGNNISVKGSEDMLNVNDWGVEVCFCTVNIGESKNPKTIKIEYNSPISCPWSDLKVCPSIRRQGGSINYGNMRLVLPYSDISSNWENGEIKITYKEQRSEEVIENEDNSVVDRRKITSWVESKERPDINEISFPFSGYISNEESIGLSNPMYRL